MSRLWKMKMIADVVLAICMAACRASDDKPKTAEALPQTTNGNFVLYVSNQSSDLSPVDITVEIDGKKSLSADFAVGTGHNWTKHTFQLAPGKHKIVAISQRGSARLEKDIEVKDKHWAVIDYWFATRDGKKHLTFRIQDTPIMFR